MVKGRSMCPGRRPWRCPSRRDPTAVPCAVPNPERDVARTPRDPHGSCRCGGVRRRCDRGRVARWDTTCRDASWRSPERPRGSARRPRCCARRPGAVGRARRAPRGPHRGARRADRGRAAAWRRRSPSTSPPRRRRAASSRRRTSASGRLDALVNNAGVMLLGPVEGADTDELAADDRGQLPRAPLLHARRAAADARAGLRAHRQRQLGRRAAARRSGPASTT